MTALCKTEALQHYYQHQKNMLTITAQTISAFQHQVDEITQSAFRQFVVCADIEHGVFQAQPIRVLSIA
jgi:hypothetical protein